MNTGFLEQFPNLAGTDIGDRLERFTRFGKEHLPAQPETEPDPDDDLERDWRKRIPETYWDAKLATLNEPEATEIRLWLETAGTNLILLGPVGTGKTWAAYAAARELFTANQRIAIWPTAELFDVLRENNGDTFDRVNTIEYLVLDDLGAHRTTEWVWERLEMIINARWQHQRPTIVTTNLEPGDLRETIGERAYSRLTAKATAVAFGGRDRRREQ